MSNEVICKYCGCVSTSLYFYRKHFRSNHPEHKRKITIHSDTEPSVDLEKPEHQSALSSIHSAVQSIRSGLLALEQERDALQQKLLEYDDLIAKYKKLI